MHVDCLLYVLDRRKYDCEMKNRKERKEEHVMRAIS